MFTISRDKVGIEIGGIGEIKLLLEMLLIRGGLRWS